MPEACACESCQDAAWPQAKGHDAAKRQESWRWPLLVKWAVYWDIVLPFTRRVWCLDIGYRGHTALLSLGWRYKR